MSAEDHEELAGWVRAQHTSLILPLGAGGAHLVAEGFSVSVGMAVSTAERPALTRGQQLVERLKGSLGPGLSTDEVMALTRGE